MQRLRRPSPATALAALATVDRARLGAALGPARLAPPRRPAPRLRRLHRHAARATRRSTAIGLPSDIFDFYRQYVGRGDRVYFQVRESGFSQFLDYQTAFRYVGPLLLPARAARRPT